MDEGSKRGEDLSRGESGSQVVDYSQRRLDNMSGIEGRRKKNADSYTARGILIDVFGFRLGRDGHQSLQNYGGEALVLDLGLLAVTRRR